MSPLLPPGHPGQQETGSPSKGRAREEGAELAAAVVEADLSTSCVDASRHPILSSWIARRQQEISRKRLLLPGAEFIASGHLRDAY